VCETMPAHAAAAQQRAIRKCHAQVERPSQRTVAARDAAIHAVIQNENRGNQQRKRPFSEGVQRASDVRTPVRRAAANRETFGIPQKQYPIGQVENNNR